VWGHQARERVLLFTEISEANNNAFIILIVATLLFVWWVSGYTLIKLARISDCAVITFFLQIRSFYFSDCVGGGKGKHQHEED
jgi:hypothetical protein